MSAGSAGLGMSAGRGPADLPIFRQITDHRCPRKICIAPAHYLRGWGAGGHTVRARRLPPRTLPMQHGETTKAAPAARHLARAVSVAAPHACSASPTWKEPSEALCTKPPPNISCVSLRRCYWRPNWGNRCRPESGHVTAVGRDVIQAKLLGAVLSERQGRLVEIHDRHQRLQVSTPQNAP